jgi:hypothetical protein
MHPSGAARRGIADACDMLFEMMKSLERDDSVIASAAKQSRGHAR